MKSLESKKEFAKRKVDFLAILNQYLGCHATSRTTRFFKDKLWEIMQYEDSQIACAWVRTCFEKEFHYQILSLNDPKAGSIALDVDGVTIYADFKDQELQSIRGSVAAGNLMPIVVLNQSYIDAVFSTDSKDIRKTSYAATLSRALKNDVSALSVLDNLRFEEQCQEILSLLHRICPGELRYESSGWVYYDEKGSRAIHISNLGAGLKLFATVKKLLINGAIKEHSVLVVDTPDSYLHPDWQLHFARLCVLLQERMNVRILVTTQSPVMLRALQVFAAKRGSPERMRYYLLKEDNCEVELRDVTLSTNRIYEEFAQPFDILDAIRWSD